MNELKYKSSFNSASADLLIEKTYYASSVHCSYYSCLQLAKHILLNTYQIKESTFNSYPEGSHEFIKNEISKRISTELNDRKESANFNSLFSLLKKIRKEADYSEIQIDISKANYSVKLSKDLNRILNRFSK
jgi:hypothetical protein